MWCIIWHCGVLITLRVVNTTQCHIIHQLVWYAHFIFYSVAIYLFTQYSFYTFVLVDLVAIFGGVFMAFSILIIFLLYNSYTMGMSGLPNMDMGMSGLRCLWYHRQECNYLVSMSNYICTIKNPFEIKCEYGI